MDIQYLNEGRLYLVAINEQISTIHKIIESWDWYDKNMQSKNLSTNANKFDIRDSKGIDYYNSDNHVIWEPYSKKGTTIIRTEGDGTPFLRSLSFSGIKCYYIRIHNDIYSAYSFIKMGTNGDCERVIQYIEEGGRTEFYEEGKTLAFEKKEYYKKKRKKDRFTPKIIVEYISSLGWNILDDNFWL